MIILYGDPYELNHYVLKRLLKRAGLDETLFRKVPIGDPFLHTYPEPVIVSLGDKALEHLISERDSFRWFNRVVQWGTKLIVPNLLPSKLLPFKDYDAELDEDNHRHPPRLHGIVMASYRKAQRIAVDGYQPQRQEYYLQDPLPKQFERWAQEYLGAGNHPLSFDIETPYKLKKSSEEDYDEQEYDRDIIRISFSYIPHHSVSIPFSPEYHNSIRTLLATPSQKIVWNGRTFDIPILTKQEFPVNGEIYDGMDAWHFIQSDLEKGLEFVSGIYTDILPWKHLNNAQPAYYSCIDADAALQICLKVQKEIGDRGLTDAFKTLSIDCMMYLDEAGRRGNYIDIERQNALRIMLQEKQVLLLADIQTIVPNHLKPVSVYKKEPGVPHAKVPIIGEVKICSTCKQEITSKSTHQKGKGNPCKNASTEKVAGTVYQYEVTEDFNPNSGKQVLNYIEHFGHPVAKNHKTGNKSADTKHLKKLANKYGKQHPLYTKIVEAHKISKALSTYVEGLKPDASGRVYSTYVNAPSTWRLSSRNVNMQNQGKRENNLYAKEARKTIIAPPGYLLVQADSSSIEAVMVGYFMNDPHYTELAKQSIHAFLCCKWLGWEFTPENVKKIKTEHKELYEQLKRVNHGCFTGEAEVLTQTGWVKFRDYDFASPIAEWDPRSNCVQFQIPKDKYVRRHAGSMVRLTGRSLETLVTPDHGIPVRTSQGNIQRYAAKDLPKANSIPLVGNLSGSVTVSPVVVQLLVAIQADGTIKKGNGAGAVVFHLHKQRKVERLDTLLVGRKHTKTVHPDGDTVYYIPAEEIADVVNLFAGYKIFNLSWLLSLTTGLREVFLDELPHWDGERGGKVGRQRLYMTTVRENADIVQAVAHVTGRQALLRERPPAGFRKKTLWTISFNQRTEAALECIKREVLTEYDDMIYCPVTSTGCFIVRDRNKVFCSMNTNYGMGPRLMYMNDPEIFGSLKEAKRCQEFLFEALPSLPKWHHEIRTRAQKEGYLQNPFGIRHYFYDVFSYQVTTNGAIRYGTDGLPKIKLGKDAKRAIAFLPQSSAGCFARQNIVILGNSPVRDWMPANITVHDGYCLCVPKKSVDKSIEVLYTTLTRPIPEMGNLTIGCEVEIGENWGEMEKVKI